LFPSHDRRGRTVTVDADGVIASITASEDEDEDMEALKAEMEALKSENEELKASAKKQEDLLEEVKGEVAKLAKMQSTYKPKAQAPSFKKPTSDVDTKEAKESYEEIKARRKEKRNKKTK